ncbi:fungal-specific transcription factor domain-containing protein [Phaeosphaeriaceae sp. PMI808]|nr:fungal-specific transcription factor domain-containing protein [Phaeosphaeriaceae sp. PMI808]
MSVSFPGVRSSCEYEPLSYPSDRARDRYLYKYFADHLLHLICPILTQGRYYPVGITALVSSRASMHCCLGITALHLRATENLQGTLVEQDIARHAYQTAAELNKTIENDPTSTEALQTVLLVIFLSRLVGRPNDCFLRLPWNSHFHTAAWILRQRNFEPAYETSLASWIDIVGAATVGRKPAFIDLYRQRRIAAEPSGLANLMGCEDQVMYLISEIADLEAAKAEMQSKGELNTRIEFLDLEISKSELLSHQSACDHPPAESVTPSLIREKVTALFQIAAHIYLRSLSGSFDRTHGMATSSVDAFSVLMECVPSGPDGYDRCLAWPLLVAGSISLPESSFRHMFAERTRRLCGASEFGAFSKVHSILRAVWLANDKAFTEGEMQDMHWRDIARCLGLDFLPI